MAMHMRKECKKKGKRERQKRERTTNNITYGGKHFPVVISVVKQRLQQSLTYNGLIFETVFCCQVGKDEARSQVS